MNQKDCKGCWCITGDTRLLNLCKYHPEVSECCPCLSCLVKGICGTLCDSYHGWVRAIVFEEKLPPPHLTPIIGDFVRSKQ